MPESLAQRQREYTRGEIRSIALALFVERGFNEVSVQDIADQVGISSRTFFRYFASKNDILLDYQRHIQSRLVKALQRRPAAEDAVTALRSAFIETSTVAPGGHDTIVQRAKILASAPELRMRVQGERASGHDVLVQELGNRMGVDRSTDPRPRLVAATMSAAASVGWDAWLEQGGAGDPSQWVAEAVDAVIEGLQPTGRGRYFQEKR